MKTPLFITAILLVLPSAWSEEATTYSQYLQRAKTARDRGDQIAYFHDARKGLGLALADVESGRLKFNAIANAIAEFIQPQGEELASEESSAFVFAIRQTILARAARLEFHNSHLSPADFSETRRQIATSCLKFASEVSASREPEAVAKANAELKAAEDAFLKLPWETKKEMWDKGEPDFNYSELKNPTLKAALKRQTIAKNACVYAESMQRSAKESWPQLAATIGDWLGRLYTPAPAA